MRLARRLAPLRFIGAFLRTRRLSRQLRTRRDVEAWQARQLRAWLASALAKVRFYASSPATLMSLPIVDKALLMSRFECFNTLALGAADGWRVLAGEPAPDGYSIGASTGTSGNRGLYVVSDGERYEWLGVILAKTLPNYPWESARIALVLPMRSALYKTVTTAPRLHLTFHDLTEGVEAVARRIIADAPDTIIGPPHVLRWLARNDRTLAPRRVFSCAEVLDPSDRSIIESRFGLVVREIYMATEGLLGVACDHGVLHLAEDVMHFEFERADPGSDVVSPIITDFTRRTQIMARYRLNDLLRLSATPCACGSPLQAVSEVIGRMDDAILLPAQDGSSRVLITPDVLRNAIVDADRSIDDFRLVQTGERSLHLKLPDEVPAQAAHAASQAVQSCVQAQGAQADVVMTQGPLPVPLRKLRRVERQWRPEADLP